MNLMAKKKGIRYKSMAYLPGSAVRGAAMLQGRIRASIVDSERVQLLMNKGGGRFALLPMPEINASDEALYGNLDFLKSEAIGIGILLEELIKVWREINKSPEVVIDMRDDYRLLPNLSPEEADRILPYYTESVNSGAFPNNGGGIKAVEADFEFYSSAGSIKGDIGKLKIEDFWYLDPLNRALHKLGRM